MKKLILPSGHQIKLDDDIYDKVLQYRWRIRFSFEDMFQKNILVVSRVKSKEGRPTNIILPRLIMGNPPKDWSVKFKDGNRLNMKKNNLYLVRYCKLPIKRQKWLRGLAQPKRRPNGNV